MSQQYYGQVHFLGIARIAAGRGYIIASQSYNTKTDAEAIRKVLEQPQLSMHPGKHYSFQAGQQAWHIIADEAEIIYIIICKLSYPQRCAHACLEELQRTFTAKAGDKAKTARDGALDTTCKTLLQKICQKYDNLAEIDKVASVTLKVENVKLVMQENVDLALQNCVKLESIEKSTEELEQQAGVFKRNAGELKNRMWWKNIKMKLIIGFIIIAVLGVIAGIIAYMVQKNKK